MAIFKNVVLLGTSGLDKSKQILVYNTNTFNNRDITSALGLTQTQVDILGKEPEESTMLDIYNTLSDLDEYVLVDRANSVDDPIAEFVFNNNRYNSVISGQGFNVILFLSAGEELLGFVTLLSVQGYSYQESIGDVALRKNYLVNYMTITVDSQSNGIRVDEDRIGLLKNIDESSRSRVYPYVLKTEATRHVRKNNIRGVYSSSLLNVLSRGAEGIMTDGAVVVGGGDKTYRMKLKQGLILPDDYTNFKNIQFGYYSGDPSLFIWDDTGRYSIFSITRTLEEIFGEESKDQLKPYTYPKSDSDGNMISATEIYQIPKLNGVTPTIKYFCGRYIVAGDYLFDTERQSGANTSPNAGYIVEKYRTSGFYTYWKRNGADVWEEVEKDTTFDINGALVYTSLSLVPEGVGLAIIEERIPSYLTTFLVDSIDPIEKVELQEDSDWVSYESAVSICPEISEVYINSERLITTGAVVGMKRGAWLVFENKAKSIKIYACPTKAIKFRVTESPIIINDQVLVNYEVNSGVGSYVIYDEPGYYMSNSAKELSDINGWPVSGDKEIYGGTYCVYTRENNPDKYLTIHPGESPSILQKSFLGRFRRAPLPDTIDSGFTIVGGFNGLVFYRIGNVIKYL